MFQTCYNSSTHLMLLTTIHDMLHEVQFKGSKNQGHQALSMKELAAAEDS